MAFGVNPYTGYPYYPQSPEDGAGRAQPRQAPQPMPWGQPAQAELPQPVNHIVWLHGVEEALAFPLGPGESAVLMDADRYVFYIKYREPNGKPAPLEIYDYTPHQEGEGQQAFGGNYVPREEFEALKAQVNALATVGTAKGRRQPSKEEPEHGE